MLGKQSAKRSFTLVEVVVVLALVSIVGTIIVSMLVPSSNMFRVLTTRIETKMKADQVMKILVSQVRFSQELEISADEALLLLDPEKRKLYSEDGKIYMLTIFITDTALSYGQKSWKIIF